MLPVQITAVMLAAIALEAPMDAGLVGDGKQDTQEEPEWTLPS
jgi:hypothetical protein